MEKETIELENADEIVERFFQDFKVEEVKQTLNDMLEVSLTTNHSAFSEPIQRANLLFIHKRLVDIFEANHLIFSRNKNVQILH
ncbi:hypothetical protein [Pinibacter aurantiacus]|uniref:Uncharacterized protein n=1 Tax=Pinibacter aurantiacus TaxID=2851599 RepID=A0A9E2W3J5_9BACT|nr:hypothetical protein [Pinibacter aurantiacus]MBV4356328.1 hypothetical protein [Pinibacter aurantiacus]